LRGFDDPAGIAWAVHDTGNPEWSDQILAALVRCAASVGADDRDAALFVSHLLENGSRLLAINLRDLSRDIDELVAGAHVIRQSLTKDCLHGGVCLRQRAARGRSPYRQPGARGRIRICWVGGTIADMTRVLERESQLEALRSYAEDARGGHGRMALISGEAGIGKSTLVEELEVTLPNAEWWWGACDGMSTPRALGPLTDIAAQAGGALYAAGQDGSSRDARFDALLTRLQDSAELRVVVIEDLHWADEATLDMLRFLGRRIRDACVLVVLTYRDDALAPDEPLRITLGDLASHRSTRRVALGPLSEQAVGQLAATSGLEPSELYALTGGSPFFVTEVLAAGSLGIPSSARDVVLARAAALTPEARGVLDHAALMGARIMPALLNAASEHIDELITSGLLVRNGEALRFRHEIARQAVQEEIAPHKAARLHRAVLDALLATGCTDDARLAFHAEAAGDAGRVIQHAPRAARAAAAVASHREAAMHFERAVRHAGATDIETRAMLFDEYANELGLVERWDDVATIGRVTIDLWREVGNPLREGAAETRFGTVMWRLGRGAESIAAYRRARDLLEPLGSTAELCFLYAGGGGGVDPDDVTLYITRAIEIARELDLADLRIAALNSVAYLAAGRCGDYETPLREALELALGLDLQRRAGQSYANLTEYYTEEFRMAEIEPFYLEALAYCDDHDVATFGNCARGHYAMALVDHGRWDDALREANAVLATKASPINRLSSLVAAGTVLARRGDPDAVAYLDQADDIATGVDEPIYLAWAGLPIAEASWLAGDADAARERLHAVRARLTELETPWLAAVSAWQHRLGVPSDVVPSLAPYAAQVAGPPGHAAQIWDDLHMPYHAALALGDSDDEADLREAVFRLDSLSPPAALVVRRKMRDLGLRAIPSGARASTRADPLGLTRREREVLGLVRDNLTNEQIADRLVISVKTVDHHVSAVLGKLGVSSRRDASALSGI
jgi:DNA-binding CsgD family transcriptional regulator/tetratricopeptide (TPR) repeat protein